MMMMMMMMMMTHMKEQMLLITSRHPTCNTAQMKSQPVQLPYQHEKCCCAYPDALLEFVDQVVHEADEELIGCQLRHAVLVVGHDQLQLLESVG